MQSPLSRRTYAALSLLVFMTLLFQSSTALAAPAAAQKKVVLVVINKISIQDLLTDKRTNIAGLARDGGAALMNARATNGSEVGNFYLSLGAGARANAGAFGKLGFNASENLPERYFGGLLSGSDIVFQGTGARPPKESVVNLGIYVAGAKSAKSRRNIIPGLLGESLKQAGLKTAVVGNTDTLTQARREITLVTMDFSGRTDYGDVSTNMTRVDKSVPGGLRSDREKLVKATLEMVSKADFTAVEFGDTSRINNQRSLMLKTVFLSEHEKALQAADLFIGELARRLPMDRTMLIITAPQLKKDPERGRDTLVPIVGSGAGQGMLISDTTRREGVVGNMDVAPTVLAYLGVPVPGVRAGNVMRTSPAADESVLDSLNQRYSGIYAIRQLRTPFLVAFSFVRVLGLVLALAAIFLARRGRPLGPAATAGLRIFLLALLTIPLAAFLQFPLNETNTLVSVGSLLALAVVPSAAIYLFFRKQPLAPLVLIASITALTIALDTATGAALADRSFFGSDIISGGRFYGVGNTLMGVLVATTVFAFAGAMELFKEKSRYWLWSGTAAILFVALIVGHPRLGANVGGLIAITATAMVFLHVCGRSRLNFSAIAPKFAAFLFFVPAVLRFDLPNTQNTSHAGKAMAVIGKQGGSAVMDIISRKLEMNLRGSFSYNMLVAVLMVAAILGLMLILKIGRRRGLGWLGEDFGAVSRGFLVLLWCALIVYAVNDTGSVAAQLILTYLTVPLLYLVLSSAPTEKPVSKLEEPAPVRGPG